MLEVAAPGQRAQPGDVQVDALEQEQGEEEPALPADEPPRRPHPCFRHGRGEGEHPRVDVRVLALLVGRAVVPVVLVHPPAVAQTGEDARHDAGTPLVPPRRSEDLAVRRVVPEKAELGDGDREDRGHGQLGPGVAEQHEGHPSEGEREHRPRDPGPVPGQPAAHQPGRLHLSGQFCVGGDGTHPLKGSCGSGSGRHPVRRVRSPRECEVTHGASTLSDSGQPWGADQSLQSR